MKKIQSFLLVFLLYFFTSSNLHSQVLCDDYSNAGLWTFTGTTVMPACSNPGVIGIAGSMQFSNFKMRQDRAAIRNAGSTIPYTNFRVEFDIRLSNSNAHVGLLALALTDNMLPVRTWTSSGNMIENPGHSIEVIISSAWNNNVNTGFRIIGASKFNGTRPLPNSAPIQIHQNLQFNVLYPRLERITPDSVRLSVFYDPDRSILIGSTCFKIHPGINNLDYIQHGGRPDVNCARVTNASIDNLCIYNTLANSLCYSCNSTPISTTFTHTFDCNANTGNISTTTTGGSSANYNYLWSNSMTTQNIGPVPGGPYNVIITEDNGCQTIRSTILTIPVLNITFNTNFNCTSGTGNITANLTGGTGTLTYAWSNSATTQSIGPVAQGSYTVTVTDANGCSKVATKILGPPTIYATIQSSFNCNTNAHNLSAYGSGGPSPYSYSWSNGPTTSSNNSVGAGTYTVTVTANNGCTGTASITVSSPPPPLAVTSISSVFNCASNSIDLTATVSGGISAYTYAWSGGGTALTKNVTSSGTYTFTVTDGNGCTATNSISVVVPSSSLSASISTAFDCANNETVMTANANGGQASFSYLWSNSSITQSISSNTAGTYTVTITDANGCTATASYTNTASPPVLNSTIVSVFDCSTNSIDLTAIPIGGLSSYNYSWSNGPTISSTNVTVSGTYTVTITDANGCVSTSSIAVVVPAPLTLNMPFTFNCLTGLGTISANHAGGAGPYTYTWSGTAQTTQTVSNLTAGIYGVTVTDANGCTITGTLNLGPPVITVTIQSTFDCANNVLDVQANVVGGTGPYNYNWSNGGLAQTTSITATGLVTVTVTDANGCIGMASINAVVPAPMNLTIQSSFNCSNYTENLTASITGGAGPLMFVWSNLVLGASNTNLGNGTYTVTVTDANGCTITSSYTVNIPNPLAVSFQSVFSCVTNTGTITANPTGGATPYTFNWNNAGNIQTNPNLLAGTYTVTVTDSNGCTVVASTNIGPPNLTLNLQTIYNCNLGSGNITANTGGGASPYTYAWSNLGNTQTISSLTVGTYTVTVTDVNGCSITGSSTLSIPNVTATFQTTPTCPNICVGTLTISNPMGGWPTYLFNVNGQGWSAQTYYTGLCAGNQQVEIMDAYGCRNLFNVNVPVVTDPWPKHPTSIGNAYSKGNGIDVVTDKYLTGQFYDSIVFENQSTPYNPIVLHSTTVADEDAYVVKYDECGAVWAFSFGSILNRDEGVVIRSIYDYPNGDMIVGANIHGPLPNGIVDATNVTTTTTTNGVNLMTDPLYGISKALILSINGSTGAVNWVYMIDPNVNHPTEINDIKMNDTTIYAIGNAFGDTLQLGSDFHLLQGGWDIFLMNMSANGTYTTGNSTTWGTIGDDNGEALDLSNKNTPDMSVYTTGYVSYQQVDIQGVSFPGSSWINGRDMFVAQFSGWNPSLINFQAHRSPSNDEGMDITAPGKSVLGIGFVVTGYFEQQLNLISSSALTYTHFGMGSGNKDAFVAAFDDVFDRVWSREAVGLYDDVAEAICFNPAMNSIFVTGEYSASVNDFLFGAFAMGADIEIFTREFTITNGTLGILATPSGNGDQDRGFDIEFDQQALYTTGQFGNTGQIQFNIALTATSFQYETYYARMDFGGTFFRKGVSSEAEAKEKSGVTIFPNPFSDKVQLEFSSEMESSFEVIDATGKLVYQSGPILPGRIQQSIDLAEFPKGMYLLRLRTSEGIESYKLLKQ